MGYQPINGIKMGQKAILTFDLPEDKYEHLIAVHAMDWALVAHALDQYLRNRLKYEEGLHEAADKALEETRDQLYRIMDDYGVSLDMII